MGTKNWIYGLLLGSIFVLMFQVSESDTPDQANSQRMSAAKQPSVLPIARTTSKPNDILAKDKRITKSDKLATPIPRGNLKELLGQSIQQAHYREATLAELSCFERLFVQTLKRPTARNDHSHGGGTTRSGSRQDFRESPNKLKRLTSSATSAIGPTVLSADLIDRWRDAGWDLYRCDGNTIVICEAPDRRQGRGIYAIRMNTESTIYLQSPHRFYDEGSGLIARKLFQEHPVRAVAWNTVHRREIDLAHADQQFLNAATRAIVIADRESTVVQLHGFSSQKYAMDVTSRAGSASLIVSDGSQYPSRGVLRTAANLKTALNAETVLLYPDEIDDLGGTQNRQAKLMRSLGSNRFLHVEMSTLFRQQMLSDRNTRQRFFAAL